MAIYKAKELNSEVWEQIIEAQKNMSEGVDNICKSISGE